MIKYFICYFILSIRILKSFVASQLATWYPPIQTARSIYTENSSFPTLQHLCYSLFSESFRYVVNSHLLDFLVFRKVVFWYYNKNCCLVVIVGEHTGKKKKKTKYIFTLLLTKIKKSRKTSFRTITFHCVPTHLGMSSDQLSYGYRALTSSILLHQVKPTEGCQDIFLQRYLPVFNQLSGKMKSTISLIPYPVPKPGPASVLVCLPLCLLGNVFQDVLTPEVWVRSVFLSPSLHPNHQEGLSKQIARSTPRVSDFACLGGILTVFMSSQPPGNINAASLETTLRKP